MVFDRPILSRANNQYFEIYSIENGTVYLGCWKTILLSKFILHFVQKMFLTCLLKDLAFYFQLFKLGKKPNCWFFERTIKPKKTISGKSLSRIGLYNFLIKTYCMEKTQLIKIKNDSFTNEVSVAVLVLIHQVTSRILLAGQETLKKHLSIAFKTGLGPL